VHEFGQNNRHDVTLNHIPVGSQFVQPGTNTGTGSRTRLFAPTLFSQSRVRCVASAHVAPTYIHIQIILYIKGPQRCDSALAAHWTGICLPGSKRTEVLPDGFGPIMPDLNLLHATNLVSKVAIFVQSPWTRCNQINNFQSCQSPCCFESYLRSQNFS
jgi:hypothetical protein